MTDLTHMISEQLRLQRDLGHDVDKMTDEERIQFIKDQTLALFTELNEMLQEVGWKPWATSRHVNADKAFFELRDAWQFLTNLMWAVTAGTPEELAHGLEVSLFEKHAINRLRMAEGYDGVTGKCPSCKRALDETPTTEILDADGYKTFCACGHPLGVSSRPA